ncbi:DUF1015 domain-containing protein [Candidatus Sumerlaeota bacterium]|nr:DUF1015 domain-containing protein [Candidatus Sumerlaeota bacterium]
MVAVKPFRGTRYNLQLIEDPGLVMAPPYDIITPEVQEYCYNLHPFNVIRLIQGKEFPGDDEYNNKYTRAASYLNSWKRDGILVDDMKRSIYFYEQEFTGLDGQRRTRRGFFALVKLEEYKSRKIFAHETTQAKPKADRLKLMRTTRSNLCPIFVLYPDAKNESEEIFDQVMNTRPWQEFYDKDGVQHKLWVVSKKKIIERICTFMSDKKLIIADGHHRYETALNYQREMREITGLTDGEQPFDYIMMFLSSLDSEGLVILPTHRILQPELNRDVNIPEVLEELSRHFEITEKKRKFSDPDALSKEINETLETIGAKRMAFAMLLPGNRLFYLVLKPDVDVDELIDDDVSKDLKSLDVVVLHRYIIAQVWIGNPEVEIEDDDLTYTCDLKEVINQVRSRRACAGFVLCPPKLSTIKKIVLKGELMPPKSTYFHPKIISGLVMRDMTLC